MTSFHKFKCLNHRSLLREPEKNDDIKPSDIFVYAPDIEQYASYIHYVFNSHNNNLKGIDYKIENLEVSKNSLFAKGLKSFFSLVSSRWNVDDVLNLFDNVSFYTKKGI